MYIYIYICAICAHTHTNTSEPGFTAARTNSSMAPPPPPGPAPQPGPRPPAWAPPPSRAPPLPVPLAAGGAVPINTATCGGVGAGPAPRFRQHAARRHINSAERRRACSSAAPAPSVSPRPGSAASPHLPPGFGPAPSRRHAVPGAGLAFPRAELGEDGRRLDALPGREERRLCRRHQQVPRAARSRPRSRYPPHPAPGPPEGAAVRWRCGRAGAGGAGG